MIEKLVTELNIDDIDPYTKFFNSENYKLFFQKNKQKLDKLGAILGVEELEEFFKKELIPIIIGENLKKYFDTSFERGDSNITFTDMIDLLKQIDDEEDQISVIKDNIPDFQLFINSVEDRVVKEIKKFLENLDNNS